MAGHKNVSCDVNKKIRFREFFQTILLGHGYDDLIIKR